MSLGGLLLVFSGLLYSRAAAFAPTTSDALINRYKTAAQLALIPFALSLLVAGAGSFYSWIPQQGGTVGTVTLVGFAILVIVTVVYGVAASRLL